MATGGAGSAHTHNVQRSAPQAQPAQSEWKPRGRDVVIGGIPWLARMTDKARAKLAGTIGDYIYPCPMDQRLLAELGISADAFLRIVQQASDDDAVVKAVQAARTRR